MEVLLLKVTLFSIFFLLFCLPGLPLGLWLCGKNIKKHPEAVIYGFLLGHFLSSGVAVCLIYLFGFSFLSLGFFISLAVGWLMISFKYLRRVGVDSVSGKLSFKAWDYRTYILFFLLLLVALTLTFEPFANLGKRTIYGYAYRKYFPGDFLKQVAMTAELAKGEIPPQNPWFAGEKLHYYWWYFILPASFHRFIEINISIKTLLVLSTLITNGLFLFLMFSTLRLFTSGQMAPFLVTLIGIVAHSYEGSYLWWELQRPLKGFLEQARAYNVDGLTRWFWGHPQMDGFFRSLLYSPPHLQALTFLLAAISVLRLHNVLGNLSLSLITGLMVGASVGYSVFVGLIVALWYGLYLGIQVILSKEFKRHLLSFFLSIGFVGFWIALFYGLEMFVRNPDTGLVLYTGKALKEYGPLVFLMNYGPPSIFGVLGILLVLKRFYTLVKSPRGKVEDQGSIEGHHLPFSCFYPQSSIFGLLLLLLLAVTLVSTVALEGFPSDVGLKLGLVILLTLLVFSAISLEFLHQKLFPPVFYLLIILICAPALVTVIVDWSNSSDIYNTFQTLYVSPEKMEAATWIKTHVPENAIVQSSSPEFQSPFTLVPVLGERRTAVGDKFFARIFQIPQTAVDRRKRDIRQLFETDNLTTTLELLKEYQIGYIYVGGEEKSSYPFGVLKFYRFPNLFEKVYGNSKVDIFKVLPYEPELVALLITQNNWLTISTEAEMLKGKLGKIQKDLEASGEKAVFIGAEQEFEDAWAFFPDQRKLPPGDYILSLRVKTPNNGLSDTFFTWEVIANQKGDQKQLEIPGTAFQAANTYQNLDMKFRLIEEDTFKFRIYHHGKGDIWIDKILLTLVTKDSESLITKKTYSSGLQEDGNQRLETGD